MVLLGITESQKYCSALDYTCDDKNINIVVDCDSLFTWMLQYINYTLWWNFKWANKSMTLYVHDSNELHINPFEWQNFPVLSYK